MRPAPQGPTTEGAEPPPIHSVRVRQPVSGSMMVTPPYGSAPLRVGFFVLAADPEEIGFLTYQWNFGDCTFVVGLWQVADMERAGRVFVLNFGDGTVSSLPPELYIFHTYAKPGNYVCSLVIKTVDGRSKTFFQGVVVKDAAG